MDSEKQPDRVIDFFRNERRRLIRYVRRWIDDTAERDGEDIVQDVMLSIFNRADVTIPIENLTAYVYQALRNRAIDFLRKKKMMAVAVEDEMQPDTHLTLADLLPDSCFRADSALDFKERRQRLLRAIESLSDHDKAIIIETEFEGRTFRELAEQWNVPIGTLLARKSRALKRIKEAVSDEEATAALGLGGEKKFPKKPSNKESIK
jgi:RNA polymerase sigma factor (sigma-70 family)